MEETLERHVSTVGLTLRLLVNRGIHSCAVAVLPRRIHNPHLTGHDLDRGSFFAFAILPLPSLQLPFDVDVTTLGQIFAADLCQSPEADDSEPLYAFLPRALSVFPTLVDRDTKRSDWLALRSEPDFWRSTKESDENDFIHTLRHR